MKILTHKEISGCQNGHDRENEHEAKPNSHILNKRSAGKSQPSAAGSASEGLSTDNGWSNLAPKE